MVELRRSRVRTTCPTLITIGALSAFSNMKQLLIPLLLLSLSSPAFARRQSSGYSNQCFEEVYREEYIPGTVNNPGRVRRWTEQKEVPCAGGQVRVYEEGYRGGLVPEQHTRESRDDNSCVEGSILGGITGGALGGVLSTQENWIWSIPAGVVGGALAGCQIDGG